MAYDIIENSEQDGKPIELYLFTVGSTEYKYTNAQEIQTSSADAGDFIPIEIDRTQPEQSKELSRTSLTVSLPRDAEIAQRFVAFVPNVRIHLVIYRQHEGDITSFTNHFIKVWEGNVKSVTWKEAIAEIQCDPTMMGLKRMGLRMTYGPTCQNALYGTRCGVLKEDFQTDCALDAVDGIVLTADEIGATANDEWFPGGYAERANGEIRFIVAQSGNTITILYPFNNLLAGETVSLFAGCKHDIETCFTKFNTDENVDAENFFGFHVNPKRNPYTTGLK